MSDRPYPDFEVTSHSFRGETYPVFTRGRGPAVIVMHEVPDLHTGVADFARTVVDAGFTVYMPSLLGQPGRSFGYGRSVARIATLCVARQFTMFATRKNSPITDWLRDLARRAHEECGGPGVGAIGMCLTGGFALAMMADDIMLAPVLSQPSLPAPLTRAMRRDLGIDDATLARVKQRAREGVCVMGLRFSEDRLAPGARFGRLAKELGDNFIAVEIDSSPGNAHGIGRTAHSVVTVDLVDEPGHPTAVARDRVLEFFSDRLHATAAGS